MGERKVTHVPSGTVLHYGKRVEIDPRTGEWQWCLPGIEVTVTDPPPPVTGDLCHVPGCLGGRRCPAHGAR